MSKVLEGLKYSKSHEWVKKEGNIAIIGISDYAQESLGAIVYAEVPEEGEIFERGQVFGAVESTKAASDVYTPVSGKVIKVNEDVLDTPELINQDAYDTWLIKIDMEDDTELDELMSSAEYERSLK